MFSYIGLSSLIAIIPFVLGVYWCYSVIKRFPEDLQELREPDDNYRIIAIIVIWLLTMLIAIVVLIFAIPVIVVLVKAVYDLFTIS
jgi:hypothetical protein